MAGWQHLGNTGGTCLFAADRLPFSFIDLMKAITGWDLTYDESKKTGRRISTILHAFNLREGFKPGDYLFAAPGCGQPSPDRRHEQGYHR
jgi:aldehyde:ferredoxin oxidoreductase